MSDNKNINEEYQYVDETEIEPVPVESEGKEESDSYSDKINTLIQQPNIRRNAIIAVLALFILLILIKCSSSLVSKQKENTGSTLPYQQQTKKQESMVQSSSAGMSNQLGLSNTELSQLQDNQNNLRASITALNEQVSQLSNQIGVLSNNYQSLQQEFLTTQNKLNVTTQSLEELIASQKSKPVLSRQRKSIGLNKQAPVSYPKYFVQAIIPGRAWLINTNGTTLTVTPGSSIPGYGVVRNILAQDGRVITSSGKILKFNQEN